MTALKNAFAGEPDCKAETAWMMAVWEAEGHAGDVGGSGAVVAHLAEGTVGSVQADVGGALWLLALWD
jgi:hypothetical protein